MRGDHGTFAKASDGFRRHRFVGGFVKNKGKCCHCWAPDQSEDVVIKGARRRVHEVALFGAAAAKQNLRRRQNEVS